MDWQVLFSFNFWFSSQPGVMTNILAKFLLIIFVICLIIAVIFYLVARAKKDDRVSFKLIKKLQNLFTTLGIVGFIILFFFWQQIPYLSSRYWLIIWLIVALIWAGFIGRFGFFEAPKRRAEISQKQKFEQYLPKKKKK